MPEGPGINDDGSGVAMLLAQAQELAEGRYDLRQKIRFMFFSAEEDGLIGSTLLRGEPDASARWTRST